MTRFDDCLPLILASEGGYSDNPADTGGPTNLGITQATLTDWLKRPASIADVQALNPSKVAPIYKARYWTAAHCGVLPPGVDYMVFDTAVQSGVNRACRYLQRAVGAHEDGIIGPLTLSAVAGHSAPWIISRISDYRRDMYVSLSNYSTFGKGWLKRLAAVTTAANEMASGT